MFDGNYARYLSADRDDNLQRQMGTRSVEEFAEDLLRDAASPEHLYVIAIQLDRCAARCRADNFEEAAKRWDEASTKVRVAERAARKRLAKFPTRETHPGFYASRPATRPGLLDSDLILPLAVRLHLDVDYMPHAIYEPSLRNGAIYSIGPTKLGYTWMTPAGGGRAFKLKTQILRGLMARGHTEAVPLSEVSKAA